MTAEIYFKDDPEIMLIKGERLTIEIGSLTDSFYIKDLEKGTYIFYCEKHLIEYARIIEDADNEN